MKHVIVVGAGFGGLSAAAHLHAAGFGVTVVERAANVGGKAGLLEKDGFVFDTGPTLLTMPEVVDDAFRAAGSSLAAHVSISRLDPVARDLFASGHELVVSADHEETKAQIARFSRHDADAWIPFIAECKEIWEVAGAPYLEAPFDGILGYSQRALRRGSREVRMGLSLGTLAELGERWFESPEMRMFVGRFATYAGGEPSRSTGAFGMIPYLEVERGAFYPHGGMHRLACALEEVLRRAGVRFLLGRDVSEVLLDEMGNARGVAIDGEELVAEVVVLNVDPLVAAEKLFPRSRGAATLATALGKREPSLSGIVVGLGVEGDVPAEAHHTVLFPADYAAEFDAIFRRHAVPSDPTIYVSIPSLADRTRAPQGSHVLFCLVNAPSTAEAALDDGVIRRVRDRVVCELDRRFCPGIAARIRTEVVLTPHDIERTGSAHGSIYGAAPHGATATFERPKHRADFARGVYFVSGATHPGGGVPMVMKGGRFVAEAITKDDRPKKAGGLGLGRWFG
ncbi:phytoene desaturase family protein [soil metagenome]